MLGHCLSAEACVAVVSTLAGAGGSHSVYVMLRAVACLLKKQSGNT